MLLHQQPLKGLYLTGQVLTTLFIRLPLWTLFSIFPSWRPRPSWSIARVLMANIVKLLLEWELRYRDIYLIGILALMHLLTCRAGPLMIIPSYLDITPGPGVHGVWVDPVPHLITGALQTSASTASVSSIRIPGYWLYKEGSTIQIGSPPVPGEKVIYTMHGGAYVMCSGHPNDPSAAIGRGFLEHCVTVHRVFSIEYRLSVGPPHKPANPFPAALLDALAGYNYLINVVGFSPLDIIIEGDSAGGNLALALTRYLIEYQNTPDLKIPAPPSGLILLSPWVDIGVSHCTPGSSAYAHEVSDVIQMKAGSLLHTYSSKAFLGPLSQTAADSNAYISPGSISPSMSAVTFVGYPRTFIVGGGAEVLIDQIRTLKDRMIRDLGEGDGIQLGEGKIRYREPQDAKHDFLMLPWHEPERGETFRELAKWIGPA